MLKKKRTRLKLSKLISNKLEKKKKYQGTLIIKKMFYFITYLKITDTIRESKKLKIKYFIGQRQCHILLIYK